VTALSGVAFWAGWGAAILSFIMAGAGHGWVAPLWVSLIDPLLPPLAWLAWFFRPRLWARVLALLLFVAAWAAALLLFISTRTGNIYYARRMWNEGAWLVCLWAAAWTYVLLQSLMTFATFRRPNAQPAPNNPPQ
jgi:hypothetical protein